MEFPGRSKSKDGIQDNIQKPVPAKKTVLETHGFTIGKVIGSGTYAKVKLAYSEEFKSSVAIKIISKTKAPREYLTKFLPREVDVVKELRHENLIRFYQSIETTHRVYLIMQYADNGSLLDLIRKHGHLNEDIARKYFRQLISAIDYCHGQGVVHRDIKCENLLLDKNFDLKIIDFGFARKNMKPINNRPIMSETYCGSYAYASPEVLKGIPYDPRYSDCWATGVVLFAMVYGRLPFDGSNYTQLLKQVQNKVVFPKDPQVSQTCKNLILKILSPLKVRLSIKLIKEEPWYKEPIKRSALQVLTESPKPKTSSTLDEKPMNVAGGTFLKSGADKAPSAKLVSKKESRVSTKTQKFVSPHPVHPPPPAPPQAVAVSKEPSKKTIAAQQIEKIHQNKTDKNSSIKLETLSIKLAENSNINNAEEKSGKPVATAKADHTDIMTKGDGKLELLAAPAIIRPETLIVETAQIVSETTKTNIDIPNISKGEILDESIVDGNELKILAAGEDTNLQEEGAVKAQ